MSFSEHLKQNQMKHAETALLQTIFQDPNQSIGDIWEALESDDDGEVMWEMFKAFTIGKLVTAGVTFAEVDRRKKKTGAFAPKPQDEDEAEEEEDEEEVDFEDEEEDEFEDDEEEDEEDEGDEEDEEEEEEEEPKKPQSRKKKKASSSKKKEPKALDLSSPESQKAYRHAVIKCLKTNKARDEDTGMKSTEIRQQVNGDAKQFRDAINELIEAERVSFGGKARGMKYWLS